MGKKRLGKTIRIDMLALLLVVLCVGGCLSKTAPGGSGSSGTTSDGAGTFNGAPSIKGSPKTAVMAGDVYAFTPSASDPDKDKLTFSIQGKPAWSSFDAATGRLSGQPLLGNIGVYSNIRISTSDGTYTATMPAFSITVTDSALGSMALSWTPPTENADGTPLTNLAGYKIYYGLSQGNYPNLVRIDNPSISTYLIDNLLPDTYYVVATSFNSVGVESAFSNVAIRTVTAN